MRVRASTFTTCTSKFSNDTSISSIFVALIIFPADPACMACKVRCFSTGRLLDTISSDLCGICQCGSAYLFSLKKKILIDVKNIVTQHDDAKN